MNLNSPKSLVIVPNHDVELEDHFIEKEQGFFLEEVSSDTLQGKNLTYALLKKMSLVHDYNKVLLDLSEQVQTITQPFIISFINAHCLNLCHSNTFFQSAILQSDKLYRDGKGMELLCKFTHLDPGVNMCGTDIIPMLLDLFKEKTVAMIGTQEPYLSKAAATLKKKGNRIVFTIDGFQSFEDYVGSINNTRPEVILLGMGMPKQEILSAILKAQLTYPCLIINGGAIIDHMANKMSRAPKWMRKTGFEWLYRLMQEPRRLFRRYIVGNLVFLFHLYKAR